MNTAPSRLPAGFRAYGEVVMAAPAHPGDLAHRPAYRWIAHPAPATAPAPGKPTGADALLAAQRTGHTFVRPACEAAPDPAETTASIGWRDGDVWQISAGWADHQHHARPCPAAQCFPDQG